ncbi:MAG: DNA alkylation repair protein [candidate division Zixibacteria bacterium]|nr:DNA alkylation repair protein [candidate division Zixibacteria bacterium]
MITNEIILNIKREIKKHDKPENKSDYQRFFKEKLKDPVRLKTPVLRKISNQCFKEYKDLPKNEILSLCDNMLASGEQYMRFFAFEWAFKISEKHTKQDFTLFESWLKKYVNNWGSCDHLCCSSIGSLILKYPELVSKSMKWTKSKNIWFRRASAVCLITPVHKGLLLDKVFKTADILLKDEEDLVQKGYGWMLKEAGNIFPDEIFAYVMKHKDEMPRTALRYAIEKYPKAMRAKAMKKD